MKTVNIPAKACPVVDEVDVLVVGGGAAGIGAAIGAAPVSYTHLTLPTKA